MSPNQRLPLTFPNRHEASKDGFRAYLWRWALCLALPVIVAGALYVHVQQRLRWPVELSASALSSSLPSIRWSVDVAKGPRGAQMIRGSVLDELNHALWLRPTLVLLGPDGRGLEYRVNLRSRTDLVSANDAARLAALSEFEVQVARDQLPPGRPLRIVLRLNRDGGRVAVATNVDVDVDVDVEAVP